MKEYKELFQSKPNRKIIRDYLNEVYSIFNANGMNFVETFRYKIDKNLELNKEIYFHPESSFSVKNEELVEQIVNKIKSGNHKNNELLAEFIPEAEIQIGHRLENIPQVVKFSSEGMEPKTIGIEEGKSTLIYIWSSNCPLSIKHLKYLFKIYLYNQRSWESHLRIILINVDTHLSNSNNFINLIKKDGKDLDTDYKKAIDIFKSIISTINIPSTFEFLHYHLPFVDYQDNPYIKLVFKYGYPLTIVVNSDNIVQMIGSLLDANLEKIIKENSDRSQITSQSVFYRGGLKEEEKFHVKKTILELEENMNIIRSKNLIEAPHLVNIILTVKRVYTVGKFNILNPRYGKPISISSPSEGKKSMTKNNPNKQKAQSKEYVIGGTNIYNIASSDIMINPLKTNQMFYKDKQSKDEIQEEVILNLNNNMYENNKKVTFDNLGNKLSYINSNGPISTNASEAKPDKQYITPKMYFVELSYHCHESDEEIISDIFKNLNNISIFKVHKTHTKTSQLAFGFNCHFCDSSLAIKIFEDEKEKEKTDEKIRREMTKEIKTSVPFKSSTDYFDFNVDTKKHKTSVNFVDLKNNKMEVIPSLENDDNLSEYYKSPEFDYLTQYFCPFCPFHCCYDCGNKITSIKNPKKMHNHNLIMLRNSNINFIKYILQNNVDNDYQLDFKYFQNNNFPRDINHYKTHYQAKCDGCLCFPIKTTRWKCCNCVFKNLCDRCFSTVNFFNDKQKDENQFLGFKQDIIENLKKVECDPIEHVFMKIEFDGYFY